MKPPGFWGGRTCSIPSVLLTPLSWLFQTGGAIRNRYTPSFKASVPVICIGNATMGGAGKTPVALDLGQRLKEAGHRPHFLSRGYGGWEKGPLRVDLTRHAAKDVGDEPLLLARIAPTWIARDRAAGARSATDHGATHIVMDDGYQNPSLYKDRNILVIDALTGFGNGAVFPAGPLREPVTEALSRADVIVVLGEGDWKSCLPEDHGLPLLRGHVIPHMPDMLNPREICVAFAGIAYPEKFYKSMELLGLTLAHKVSYPDHYDYREKDLETLRKLAQEAKAVLVTTYKDWIRLPGKQQEDIIPLPVSLKWEDDPTVLEILLGRDEK